MKEKSFLSHLPGSGSRHFVRFSLKKKRRKQKRNCADNEAGEDSVSFKRKVQQQRIQIH